MGCFSTNVAAPPPQNLAQQATDTLQTQIALAPQQLGAYQATAPGYASTDVNIIGTSLFGPSWTGNLSDINTALTQQAAQQTTQGNTALRQANINDVSNLGGQALAQMQALNPQLYSLMASQAASAGQGLNPINLGQINLSAQSPTFDANPFLANTSFGANAVQAANGNPLLGALGARALGSGIDPLLQQEGQTAASQLALGGQLTPDQLRAVQQSSRAGFAARGLDATNASVTDEALQTQAAQQAMLQQRLSQAGAVESQGLTAQQLQNTLGLGVGSQALGYGQLGLAGQTSNQAAQLQAQGLGLQAQTANQDLATTAAGLNSQNYFNALGFNNQVVMENIQTQATQAQINAQLQAQAFAQQQQALQNYAAMQFNPYATILGEQTGNQGSNQALFGNSANTSAMTNQNVMGSFNPFNSYASDLYNTNYNSELNSRIASSNNSAGLLGGLLGFGGKLGSAAIGQGLFG